MSKKNSKKTIIKEHNEIMSQIILLNHSIGEFFRLVKDIQYTEELLTKLLNQIGEKLD